MKPTLQKKVTALTAVVVVAVTVVTTLLSLHAQRKGIEREVSARGIALAEALARSVDEGLAAENLNLIKHFEDTVHTKDVILAQVFSTLWLGVASIPGDQLNVPPEPDAISFFKKSRNEHDYYLKNRVSWIDIYTPIFLDPHDRGLQKVLIGYVRISISTGRVTMAAREAVITNIGAAGVITLLAVLVLNVFVRKYLLKPISDLHHSIVRHKEGSFAAFVPVAGADEIAELSMEFNEMSRMLQEREEKLAEEKERLAVTLSSIGDSVVVTGVDGQITMINKVAEQQTGWTAQEAKGRKLPEVFHIVNEESGEICEHPVEKVIKTGLTCGLANHTVLIRKDGTRVVIEDSAAPIRDQNGRITGIVLVFRDVTEKRRLEEEYIKAEKLQSLGLLAGGLAHDFNNLLTSMVGNISMAKMHLDARSKAQVRLQEAETAARRATDLTYQLLTFAKGGAPVKKTQSIVDTLLESTRLALSGTAVAPEFQIAEGVWSVAIDGGQMIQVFNNLIINAVQAMPGGGTIRFSVANTVLSDNLVPTLPAGAYIHLAVHDTGTGIPVEYRARIFDPYFTTKEKGSGLGLASAYSIIKRHDGHITVESEPGQGTTFHLYLPASPLEPEMEEIRAERNMPSGQGKVLFMDDEQIIRDVAAEMLQTLGYEVDCVQNGAEAIERYQKALAKKQPYTVVITDLTIAGGMGGKETIRMLRAIDPNVKAIVSSGYSNDPIMACHEQHGFQGVITKPYSIGTFSKVIYEVLQKK